MGRSLLQSSESFAVWLIGSKRVLKNGSAIVREPKQVAYNDSNRLRQPRKAAAQVVLNGLSMIGSLEDRHNSMNQTSVSGSKRVAQPMDRLHEAQCRAARQ
jgi:hypothetical protein